MFDEMVVSSPNPKKTNKPWTVILSMIFQVAFLAVLILIPLIYTEALPKTMMATLLVAPPPPPPPPPPPIAQIVHVKPQVHLMDAGKLVTPKVIPKDIKIIKEDAPVMSGMQGGARFATQAHRRTAGSRRNAPSPTRRRALPAPAIDSSSTGPSPCRGSSQCAGRDRR